MTITAILDPYAGYPALVVEYTDIEEGFRGWLVRDRFRHSLCAGGMRVQPGLSRENLVKFARNMTLKMDMAGLRVDGAKGGIDYDPASPGREYAMARFMRAIRPYIETCYSMGPDLNVEMADLEKSAKRAGIPCVKMAIARARGWELAYFLRRYEILNTEMYGGRSLEKLRAGYGAAAAVRTVLDFMGIPYGQASLAIQGFGAMAKAMAHGLMRDGIRVVALSDVKKCLISRDSNGLDMASLLQEKASLLPDIDFGELVSVQPTAAVFDVRCDVFIPAAIENTVTEQIAPRVEARALVPCANLAVTPTAEEILSSRGIFVLPDFLVGCGGSISMDCLFGPKDHPDPYEVLAQVENRMSLSVMNVLNKSIEEGITPTQAALHCCLKIVPCPSDAEPYGELE